MAGPSLIAEGMNWGGAGSVHTFVGQVIVVEMVADGNGTPDHKVGEYLKGGRLAGRCGTICRGVSIVNWFTTDNWSPVSSFLYFCDVDNFDGMKSEYVNFMVVLG